ncbi:hypothetical protein [Methylomicrobium lacus]|uniref:hypothetical protein n=1 Tax=Methylomicrobium lacus TaxID=136992 RepID=UPI00045EA889|nr:hypothetical protein [Methylomicrobium lacus]
MIGFEMKATGSGGFRQNRGAWTEGSLIALKVFATAGSLANKDSLHSSQRGIISQIESNFSAIAKNRFKKVCSCSLNFTLFMKGDIKFKYYFDSSKKSEQIQSELYNIFASATDEIGDQVIIYFCAIVDDFILTNFNNYSEPLILTIEVDL